MKSVNIEVILSFPKYADRDYIAAMAAGAIMLMHRRGEVSQAHFDERQERDLGTAWVFLACPLIGYSIGYALAKMALGL